MPDVVQFVVNSIPNHYKQGGARVPVPGADNGLIFLKMCTVVVVVDLSVRSAGGDHSSVSDEKHSCCVEGDFDGRLL